MSSGIYMRFLLLTFLLIAYRELAAMKIVIKPINYLNIQDSQKRKMELVLDPEETEIAASAVLRTQSMGDQNLRMRVKEETK